jgi:hypothetical protein
MQQDIAQIAVIQNTAEPPAAATTLAVMAAKPSSPKVEATSCVPPFTAGMSKSEHFKNPFVVGGGHARGSR